MKKQSELNFPTFGKNADYLLGEKVSQWWICSNLLGLVLNPVYIPCVLKDFVVLGMHVIRIFPSPGT